MRLKVAMLIPDNRDEFRQYDEPQPFFGSAPTALLEGLAQLPEIELHVISCSAASMAAPTKLARNIYFHLLHVRHGESLRSLYIGNVLAIRKKLRELRPDLVHGQGTERYPGFAAALSGFPNVVTLHGIMRGMMRSTGARIGSFYWCNALLESYTLRRTDGVFCNSAYTERMVKPFARKTWRVANALRPIFFEPKPIGAQRSEPTFLNVGTIAPHKQQLEILRLATRLFEAGCTFQLRFIGNAGADEYGAQFLRTLADLQPHGFASRVQPRTPAELLRQFDAADALIHFPREESFGLVVAEALARNLKVFAARTGGVADICSGVEMADVYEMDDWSGLEEGLARWIRHDRATPSLAAEEMKRRYHPSPIAAQHLEIYAEVARTGRAKATL